MSAKGKFVRLLSGFALERASVESVRAIGAFRLLDLRWRVNAFAAGDKVQLLLPSDDMRTYTPIASEQGVQLLGWIHGQGPGARWLSSVQRGDVIPFVGPQRSLAVAGAVVLVGDETSVAVAAALQRERPQQVLAVIQSNAPETVHEACASLNLRDVTVLDAGDTGGSVAAVLAGVTRVPGAVVALTGGASLVVDVRDALRRARVTNVVTKAYWIPGRSGLD